MSLCLRTFIIVTNESLDGMALLSFKNQNVTGQPQDVVTCPGHQKQRLYHIPKSQSCNHCEGNNCVLCLEECQGKLEKYNLHSTISGVMYTSLHTCSETL